MACKEEIVFIILSLHLLSKPIAVGVLEMNHEYILFLGDCRFVSATFRLFKLPKTGPTKRCQVIYNGGITGHEKELIFDANFTFKVNKDFHDLQHSSYSSLCSRNLFLTFHWLLLTFLVLVYVRLSTYIHTHIHIRIYKFAEPLKSKLQISWHFTFKEFSMHLLRIKYSPT